jgi:O-antigen/teichoic acid export membrane protein
MGVVVRQSVKTMLVVAGGAVLGALTLWISARYLPKQGFGFFQNITKWVVLVTQLLLLGLGSSMSVFVHNFAASLPKKRVLLTYTFIIPTIFLCICTLVFWASRVFVIAHFQPADKVLVNEFFVWLPVYTGLFMFTALLEQYLGSQMKVAISAFLREVVLRVVSLVFLCCYAINVIDFHAYVIGSIAAYLIPAIIMFTIAVRTEGFGVNFNWRLLSKDELVNFLQFTWYHYFLGASFIVLASMDTALLPFYDNRGLTANADYAVAVFLLSFVQIPFRAIVQPAFASMAEAYSRQESVRAEDIYRRSSLNMLIGTLAISAVICCSLTNIVSIIGEKRNYTDVYWLFLILFVGKLVDIATGMNDQLLSITNNYRFTLYASLVTLILNYILIRFLVPQYGGYGAAISTTITLCLFNFAKFIYIRHTLKLIPFSKKTLVVILCAIPAVVLGYVLPNLFTGGANEYLNASFDAALRSSVVTLTYIAMLIWLKPSPDLTAYIDSIKKTRRLF